jgi:acyl carrier protein
VAVTRAEILAVLGEIAREHVRPTARIDADADLIADLGLDSMTATALVIDVEDRFGIDLPDTELVGVRRIGELVALVARRLAPC